MKEPDPTGTARPHVLIVDDSPANLSVLQGVLESAGFYVLVATNGERALSRLAYLQPALILLDVNMPGLDGYETCRRIKADPRWQEVPVLFITARDDAEDKVRGFGAGGVDYITKPLHPGEVLARVRAHLQIRSLQQTLAEQNALLESAMARRLEAEAQLQQSIDRAMLLVETDGEVEFCTHQARRLLGRYFPSHADATTLPPLLVQWLADELPTGSWTADSLAGGRLEVQRFAHGSPGAYIVLRLVEHSPDAGSPARLLHLGLTASEADVLYWAAHGKSNQEVALILGKTVPTVKKHVVNLMAKMDVDTRLIAALQAAEILELKVVDPDKLREIRERDEDRGSQT